MTTSFSRHSLAEGVNLYIHHTKKFKTTSIYVYLHQPLEPDTVTLGALLPVVLARGSEEYPTTPLLVRRLDELYGASFGQEVSRRGEVQTLGFRMEIPSSEYIGDPSLLDSALQTLAGVVFRPAMQGSVFKSDFVDQEKSNLRRRIEGLINDKQSYSFFRCTQEMCQGEPFALYRLGRVQDLDAITPQSLHQFHQRLLATAPVNIFVVTGEEPALVRAMVEQAFQFPVIGPRLMPQTVVKRAPAQPEPRVVRESLDVSQGILVMGIRTGLTLQDDLYAPMLVANGILGGFQHSKLFQQVREAHSLAYYAYSALETVKGLGYLYAGIEFDDYQQAVDLALEQLRAIQDGQITPEELETTRRALINETLSSLDSPGHMVDLALDGVFTARPLTIEERIAAVEAVTAEQAAEAARHFAVDTIYFLTGEEDQ